MRPRPGWAEIGVVIGGPLRETDAARARLRQLLTTGPALARFSRCAADGEPRCRPQSACEHAFDEAGCLGEIHLPRELALQRRDDFAHVLHAGGPSLRDRRCDGSLDLVLRHLLRQVARNDRDLVALLLGELGAAALVIE